MAQQNIHRNLESGQIYIPSFHSGLYTQRNPIFTPLSAMGLQMISRYDTLWDGLNMELSNESTLQRRPGFPVFCATPIVNLYGSGSVFDASTDIFPLTFFSFKNNKGDIRLMMDTNDAVYTFDTAINSAIYLKTTSQQTSFAKVGDHVYMVDGTESNKWDGTTVSIMGIPTPQQAPTFSFDIGPLLPIVGYTYVYSGRNSQTGHVGTASPLSTPTGSIENKTNVESVVTIPVTSIYGNGTSILVSTSLTSTPNNCNFQTGQKFTMSGLTGAAAVLNGVLLTVLFSTGGNPSFTASSTYNHAMTLQSGLASLIVSIPSGAAFTPYSYQGYQCAIGGTFLSSPVPVVTWATGGTAFTQDSFPGTPAAGHYVVDPSTGRFTFAAADYAANIGRQLSITYTSQVIVGTAGVSINLIGDSFADPQVDKIALFRNEDGGSLFYLLTDDIDNPYPASTWKYADTTPDLGLNTDIVAPIDDANDMPPVGANILVYHMGRLWCAWKNYVQFSAGPDCTYGVGEEAWPPANVFAFPGKVTGLASTSAGLIVLTTDDMYVVYGTSLVSFYPTLYQKNFGVASQNCIAQDGDLLFMYTSARQLYMFSGNMSEVGFPIGDKFALGFNPANTILALHRHGPDSGLFISDGSTSMYKYRIDQQAWSPVAHVVGGSGALASIETSVGEYTLLTGQSVSGGYSANYILGRNTLVFQDCGISYPAYVVVGTLTLAAPGTTSILDSVMIERMPAGSDATVSVLCNEIAGTYVTLPNPVNDPPLLRPQTSIIAKRHYVRSAQTPLAQQVRHLLVQVAFPVEAVKNELLSLALN